jgi:ABC-type transport system involved in multi-copper enzyme maturation permease subunit
MTIREKGYHRWEGEFQESRFHWFPIFLSGIKNVIRKKFAKSTLALAIAPLFVFLLGIYISTKPELKMLSEVVRMLKNEPLFFAEFASNGFIIFMLMILGIFFGAELISGDIKFNSFPLYFSRPLDRKDYIMGKFAIIMFYFLMVTLVPNLILLLFKIILTGKLEVALQTILALIIVPIITSFLVASITLMVSSLSSNSRYVKIIIFVVFFFSDMLANILHEIFRNSYFHAISLTNNIRHMSSFIFGTKSRYHFPGLLSMVIILAVTCGAFLVLYKRIGRAEAQIETGN